MGNRMNAGYLITDSIHIGTTEFVLGVSITERPTFVTWACQGSDYYYWGHYHSNLLAAKKDLRKNCLSCRCICLQSEW